MTRQFFYILFYFQATNCNLHFVRILDKCSQEVANKVEIIYIVSVIPLNTIINIIPHAT